MTLARTVAHTVHYEAMLDGMDPREFDVWMTMYKIRPWGLEPFAPEEEKPERSLEGSLAAFRRMTGV